MIGEEPRNELDIIIELCPRRIRMTNRPLIADDSSLDNRDELSDGKSVKYILKIYSLFLINLAGFPAQISNGGMSLVTTDDAPTIAPSPIVTDLQINVLLPM